MLLKFELPRSATTSCKNVETLRRKNDLSFFKSLLVTSFEHGLVLLATLIKGGGGITSTRSWTGHLSQNTVQCLKYVCDWLLLEKQDSVTFLFNAIKAISKGFAVVPAFRCDSFTTISHDSCGEYPCSHQWQINFKYFFKKLVSATGKSRRKKQKSSPIIGFSLLLLFLVSLW